MGCFSVGKWSPRALTASRADFLPSQEPQQLSSPLPVPPVTPIQTVQQHGQHCATSPSQHRKSKAMSPSLEFIKREAAAIGLAIDDETAQLFCHSPQPAIAAGSSGGKDSDCLVILLDRFLNAIDYQGDRIVIHADLGSIEHVESIEQVRRLASFVNWKLVVVKREKGGLLERYEQRWRDNCLRYATLRCVTLISPWPQANAPFCRSEVKVAPITQALPKLFPGQTILNAVGIRAEESASRAKKPIAKPNKKLKRADGTNGRDWFPLLNTTIETVWLTHRKAGFPRHIQYDRGNERISCAYCFLASLNDWQKGAEVPTNHDSYRRLCGLEIRSSFSYRKGNWLSDVRSDLLQPEDRTRLNSIKEEAVIRQTIEQRIPKELLFSNHGGRHGWPISQPTLEQCEILASVRREINKLLGSEIERAAGTKMQYTSAHAIYERYAQLLKEKQDRLGRKRIRSSSAAAGIKPQIIPQTKHAPTPLHSTQPIQTLLF